MDSDSGHPGSECICVQKLDAALLAALERYRQARCPLESVLRVRVVGEGMFASEDLPDMFGRYQVSERGIKFVPHFPFEPGVRYIASFDPRPLALPGLSEVATLEFSLPRKASASPTEVVNVFPSSETLPENLLRFYVCFSNSMQRGRVETNVKILGPDGQVAPDVLYRAPVELWDRSMRFLTILLDPGRLKRGVGPNRKLGPPLKPGLEYTLAIESELVDWSGNPLRERFHKTFSVTKPVRERVVIEHWKISHPATMSRQPLALTFPRSLDWALLWRSITVVAESGQAVEGRVTIEECETRWNFTPISPWTTGTYHVRIASGLEDVCGNNLLGPFDRALRTARELEEEKATHSIPFTLA